MKEYILFKKINTYREIVRNKPLSTLSNILFLAYLALAKKYKEIMDYAVQISININKPNILIEDFHLLSYIGTDDIKNSKVQVKYNLSIDPEDSYTHLLNSIVQKMEGSDFLNEIKKAYLTLSPTEKKTLTSETKFNEEELEEKKNMHRIPENVSMGEQEIQRMRNTIQQNPQTPIFKLSLAEALFKAEKKEEAKKEVKKVLALFPNYPGALYLADKIVNEFAKEDEESEYLKKIFEGNPLSTYLKGKESMFIQENEKAMFIELRKLFDDENPFITFFKEKTEKVRPGEKKESVAPKREFKKIPEGWTKTLEGKNIPKNGFDDLKNKKYVEALIRFIDKLKKE